MYHVFMRNRVRKTHSKSLLSIWVWENHESFRSSSSAIVPALIMMRKRSLWEGDDARNPELQCYHSQV